MRSPSNVVDEARKIFRKISGNSASLSDFKFDLDTHNKLLNLFQVGDHYYYIFNVKEVKFELVSSEVTKVLGYPVKEVNVPLLLNSIHPEDTPWFLNFENKVTSFFSTLKKEQILKYKVRYDYRIKKRNGDYIRILQQVVTLQFDEKTGGILRTFGIHTDITHLKKEGKPVLSLIGLENEPSYLDVNVDKVFAPSKPILSSRERQVLNLLIEGKNSESIAKDLYISIQTVSKHRKNMLRKTKSSSTAELVGMAVKKGWV